MKIGDKVVVINCGEAYTTYLEWLINNKPNKISKYVDDKEPVEENEYTLIAIAPHGMFIDNQLLCLIEDYNGVYIIGEHGIQLSEELYERK